VRGPGQPARICSVCFGGTSVRDPSSILQPLTVQKRLRGGETVSHTTVENLQVIACFCRLRRGPPKAASRPAGSAPLHLAAAPRPTRCPGCVRGRTCDDFRFFAKAGAFVFGSRLAIVPFLYSGVVNDPGCLNVREFLDAVDVAMISSCALMAMIPMTAAPTV
jgi:hypothetical protein